MGGRGRGNNRSVHRAVHGSAVCKSVAISNRRNACRKVNLWRKQGGARTAGMQQPLLVVSARFRRFS